MCSNHPRTTLLSNLVGTIMPVQALHAPTALPTKDSEPPKWPSQATDAKQNSAISQPSTAKPTYAEIVGKLAHNTAGSEGQGVEPAQPNFVGLTALSSGSGASEAGHPRRRHHVVGKALHREIESRCTLCARIAKHARWCPKEKLLERPRPQEMALLWSPPSLSPSAYARSSAPGQSTTPPPPPPTPLAPPSHQYDIPHAHLHFTACRDWSCLIHRSEKM